MKWLSRCHGDGEARRRWATRLALEAALRGLTWLNNDNRKGVAISDVFVSVDGRSMLRTFLLPKETFREVAEGRRESGSVQISDEVFSKLQKWKGVFPLFVDETIAKDKILYRSLSLPYDNVCAGPKYAAEICTKLRGVNAAPGVPDIPASPDHETVEDRIRHGLVREHIAITSKFYRIRESIQPTSEDFMAYDLAVRYNHQVKGELLGLEKRAFPIFALPCVLRSFCQRIRGKGRRTTAKELEIYYCTVFRKCPEWEKVAILLNQVVVRSLLSELGGVTDARLESLTSDCGRPLDRSQVRNRALVLEHASKVSPRFAEIMQRDSYKLSKSDMLHRSNVEKIRAQLKGAKTKLAAAEAKVVDRLANLALPSVVQMMLSRTPAEAYEDYRRLRFTEATKCVEEPVSQWTESVFEPDLVALTPKGEVIDLDNVHWSSKSEPIPSQADIIRLPSSQAHKDRRFYAFRQGESGGWKVAKAVRSTERKVKASSPSTVDPKEEHRFALERVFWRPGEYSDQEFPFKNWRLPKGDLRVNIDCVGTVNADAIAAAIQERASRHKTCQHNDRGRTECNCDDPRRAEVLKQATRTLVRGAWTRKMIDNYPHIQPMITWLCDRAEEAFKDGVAAVKRISLDQMAKVELHFSCRADPTVDNIVLEHGMPTYAILLHPQNQSRNVRVVVDSMANHPFFRELADIIQRSPKAICSHIKINMSEFSAAARALTLHTLRAKFDTEQDDITCFVPQCMRFRQQLQTIQMSRSPLWFHPQPSETPLEQQWRPAKSIEWGNIAEFGTIPPIKETQIAEVDYDIVDEDYGFLPDDEPEPEPTRARYSPPPPVNDCLPSTSTSLRSAPAPSPPPPPPRAPSPPPPPAPETTRTLKRNAPPPPPPPPPMPVVAPICPPARALVGSHSSSHSILSDVARDRSNSGSLSRGSGTSSPSLASHNGTILGSDNQSCGSIDDRTLPRVVGARLKSNDDPSALCLSTFASIHKASSHHAALGSLNRRLDRPRDKPTPQQHTMTLPRDHRAGRPSVPRRKTEPSESNADERPAPLPGQSAQQPVAPNIPMPPPPPPMVPPVLDDAEADHANTEQMTEEVDPCSDEIDPQLHQAAILEKARELALRRKAEPVHAEVNPQSHAEVNPESHEAAILKKSRELALRRNADPFHAEVNPQSHAEVNSQGHAEVNPQSHEAAILEKSREMARRRQAETVHAEVHFQNHEAAEDAPKRSGRLETNSVHEQVDSILEGIYMNRKQMLANEAKKGPSQDADGGPVKVQASTLPRNISTVAPRSQSKPQPPTKPQPKPKLSTIPDANNSEPEPKPYMTLQPKRSTPEPKPVMTLQPKRSMPVSNSSTMTATERLLQKPKSSTMTATERLMQKPKPSATTAPERAMPKPELSAASEARRSPPVAATERREETTDEVDPAFDKMIADMNDLLASLGIDEVGVPSS